MPDFEIGDRVLLTTMEREGVVFALAHDGGAYVREDDGTVIACGIEALVFADPERRTGGVIEDAFMAAIDEVRAERDRYRQALTRLVANAQCFCDHPARRALNDPCAKCHAEAVLADHPRREEPSS